MNFKLLILIFSAIAYLGLAVASDINCQKLVQSILTTPVNQARTDIGNLEAKIRPYYLYSNRQIRPTRSILNPQITGHNVVDVYYANSIKYNVEIHSFIRDSKSIAANEGFYNDYYTQVTKNIDYVLSVYKDRRDWSLDFLSEVRAQAIHDADRTTYIVVRDHDDSNDIWGTLKIIRSSENNDYEELLPLEKALGIKLPFNHGFKFEPGNFTVKKEYYKESMSQLIMHLSRLTKRILKDHPQINSNEDLFYTYADRESRLMYKSLGFKVAKGYEKPILKDGKDWWVLSINGDDLSNLSERISQSRKVWNEKDKEVFHEVAKLFDSLEGEALVDENIFSNSIISEMKKRPSFVAYSRSEPHVYRGEEVQKLGIIFDKFDDLGSNNFPIPTSILPLKEGTIIPLGNKDSFAIYKDGRLIISSKFSTQYYSEVIEIELEIDPHLSHPKFITFKRLEDGIKKIEFQAYFLNL